MAYIPREDGERFVIPAYRDLLSAKKVGLIKREVLSLSQKYGNYIVLQKKSMALYEVAFSADPGYLLGECVWYHFRRPADMVYCEIMPNGAEAILVIVKNGSVFLDGNFPVDSLVEELVAFQSNDSSFDIFIYGPVPLSREPEDGKFNFDPSTVKSFTKLEEPIFPTLAPIKVFQLQPVDAALAAQGIGVLPVKKIAVAVGSLVGLVLLYEAFTTQYKNVSVPVVSFSAVVNPLQGYYDQLNSPAPNAELHNIYILINLLYTIPGWTPQNIEYVPGSPARVTSTVQTQGAPLSILADWSQKNNVSMQINPINVTLTLSMLAVKRPLPTKIFRLDEFNILLMDTLNNLGKSITYKLSPVTDHREFKDEILTITFANVSPTQIILLGDTIINMPLVLTKFSATLNNGNVTGTMTLKALGN